MELRFLKGNWQFGKFKLQCKKDGVWVDVPTVEEDDNLSEIAREAMSVCQDWWLPLSESDTDMLFRQIKKTFKKYMDKQNER